MSEIQKRSMPKAYAVLWIIITAAYGIWMAVFMRNTVLVSYETEAQRTVDGYLQPDITGMIGRHWLFPVWTVVSCIALILFIVYIKKVLYAEAQSKLSAAVCLVLLIAGCIYINWYGLLDVTKNDGTPAQFIDKVTYITASMTGLEYPWLFRGWGLLASASIFINTMYCYRRYDYNNRLGVILGSIGSAAIFITVNCPSYGETKDFSVPRCLGHWAGAALFAVCCAAPLVIFLISKAKAEKGRYLGGLIAFCIVLLALGAFIVLGYKSAIIENIPMTAAYILLFMLNFTGFFKKKD